MRIAVTAAALGAALLIGATTTASAGGDRARELCVLDLMRLHERAEAPAKPAPKKKAVKKVAKKAAPKKVAAKKPLK
jgi:hypothetical protein